jgi:hypothetical protein
MVVAKRSGYVVIDGSDKVVVDGFHCWKRTRLETSMTVKDNYCHLSPTTLPRLAC